MSLSSSLVKIAIDLDETLINNQHTFEKTKWTIKKGVLKWLPKLNKHNTFEFHCISARKPEHSEETFQILDSIETHTGIIFKTRNFTSGKAKGKYAMDLGCVALIDDYPMYLMNCEEHGVIPILLGKEKNKLLYPTWIVCISWEQIHDYLAKRFVMITNPLLTCE